MARLTLEARLDELEALPTAELKTRWQRVYSCPPPNTRGLLLLALAFELQCKATGKMSASTRDVLRSVEYVPLRSKPVPTGARLMRSWNGQIYVVETTEDGTIRWNHREWRSLSEVARAITGTRWSGPAFFGLRGRKQAA